MASKKSDFIGAILPLILRDLGEKLYMPVTGVSLVPYNVVGYGGDHGNHDELCVVVVKKQSSTLASFVGTPCRINNSDAYANAAHLLGTLYDKVHEHLGLFLDANLAKRAWAKAFVMPERDQSGLRETVHVVIPLHIIGISSLFWKDKPFIGELIHVPISKIGCFSYVPPHVHACGNEVKKLTKEHFAVPVSIYDFAT
jgi:hypothetical protein